jgi:hypothetical protein
MCLYLIRLVFLPVDENLFYKGVNKHSVHGGRLHQSHSLSDPISSDKLEKLAAPSGQENSEYPPYPFESGNSLLALTKKHNVGGFSAPPF